ncbi:MAG: phenylalanine--tRNA ligase subunit alpha, partial [Alphaproteobacteria bacterium HGW-Alphaproteobacteria-12]
MTDHTDPEKLEAEFAAAIADAMDVDTLEAVRVAALGKKGRVSDLMKGLGRMPPEERQQMGPKLNGLKDRLTDAIAVRKRTL